MEKTIKMIAMDFDFTLVDYRKEGIYISEKAIGLFEKLITNGIEVGIVTGRDRWSIKDMLLVNGVSYGNPFPSYYIFKENYIHSIPTGRIKADEGYNENIYKKNELFLKTLARKIPDLLSLLEQHHLQVQRWNVFSEFGFELYFEDESTSQKAAPILNSALQDTNCVIHRNRMILNIVARESGKGLALLQCATNRGIRPEEVLAFGDSLNDLSMLDGRYGFLSATMDNGEDVVKEVVRKNKGHISKYRASDGIYDILIQYYDFKDLI